MQMGGILADVLSALILSSAAELFTAKPDVLSVAVCISVTGSSVRISLFEKLLCLLKKLS